MLGLHEIVPKELLSMFDPRELELMISGLPQIDRKIFQTNL
jgi:E3 ubiquitin-protein ligase HUWE1